MADSAATYDAEVDTFFAELRGKVATARPDNVVAFLRDALRKSSFAPTAAAAALCQRIVPKYAAELDARPLTIVVLGASGDLAKKKTFPALFQLFCNGLLPASVRIVGYARSDVPDLGAFRAKLAGFFTRSALLGCHVEHFLSRVSYVSGSYDTVADFERLSAAIAELEAKHPSNSGAGAAAAAAPAGNRLFYLALPPTAFVDACTGVRRGAMAPNGGWTRVIVEKPFGRDSATSAALSTALAALFTEAQLYRIDHYLGKEMVQNIVTLRFANRAFSALWNSHSIANVQITFKEKIGTEGRGGYFDSFGIVRDVVQNHLTQILALVAMEKPRTLAAEDIRDEKVALLRCVEPARPEDCVLGQYTAGAGMPGYLEDPTVPAGSTCPTYAVVRLTINNDRWRGVPFILKAGKALEAKGVSVRVQFHDEVRPFLGAAQRNELVVRAQPEEAVYMKVTTKRPGMGGGGLPATTTTELDLTYHKRFEDLLLPEAYESLISDCVTGNATNFVRSDELEAAWAIFTPLLHAVDGRQVPPPRPYAAGTRGPAEGDKLVEAAGFKRTVGYEWGANL